MRLSLRSKVFLNSYLAVALAFFFPLYAGLGAFASTPNPSQQVSQLSSDLTYYTQQYSTYTGHYQQYAPNRMSELDAFASSLTTFSSAVASAQSALTASNTAAQDLATAQANVSAVPGLISTSQQALATAQTNYNAASTSFNAVAPSYSQALQDRNDAWSAYQATVVNQSVTEQFTGGVINTSIQFLVGGTTPLTNQGNPAISGNWVLIMNGGPGLQIKPPTGMTPTTLGFQTYARNGDQVITVTFNDDSTGTFTQPNGVNNPNCPQYYCNISYTAPESKTIKSFFIPGDWDILYVDNFTFSANSYNPTAYQNYLDKQSALNSIAPTYNSANSALSSATSALASAQAAYNTYSAPSYLPNLESIRDTQDSEATAAYATLMRLLQRHTRLQPTTQLFYPHPPLKLPQLPTPQKQELSAGRLLKLMLKRAVFMI